MKATSYTVSTTAVLVVPKQHFERTVIVHCKSGTAHLGNGDVTTADGYPIANGEGISIVVPINETLYAIDGGGGATLVVLDASAD